MKNKRKKGEEELKKETTIEETALENLVKWAKQSCYHYGSAYRNEMIEKYEKVLEGLINDNSQREARNASKNR